MEIATRENYYKRFGKGSLENVCQVEYPPTRTDQTFYRSVKDLVADFIATGKSLAASRQARYDFENGIDDGSKLTIDRDYQGVELPDVSQAINDLRSEVEGRETSYEDKVENVVSKIVGKYSKSPDKPDNVESVTEVIE